MALFDLPLDQLTRYAPDLIPPSDFDTFWSRTLETVHAQAEAPEFRPCNDPLLPGVQVTDVSFSGYAGQNVRAWLLEPAGAPVKRPCLITFVGYGGGRSLPADHVLPCVAGMAHFVMDTRGQGASWSPGDTPDEHGGGPQTPGFMTRGIASPETYYYRRLISDAVMAVRTAAAHPGVDPERLAVGGASQGGGLAIAAAALAADRVKLLVADVPFLCHFRRAVEITDALPYAEIAGYLRCHRDRVDAVLNTLDYFDGCHFAPRIRARSLFSVALMDTVCPPSTVFAAYNRIPAPKEIRVYPFNQHEGGDIHQTVERLRFIQAHL